jgi:hypothetical protein
MGLGMAHYSTSVPYPEDGRKGMVFKKMSARQRCCDHILGMAHVRSTTWPTRKPTPKGSLARPRRTSRAWDAEERPYTRDLFPEGNGR